MQNYKSKGLGLSDYSVKNYLTMYDGMPVGIGTWISDGKTAGIYGIGTNADLRTKELGTYLMKKIVWDLLEDRTEIIFLFTGKDSYVEKWYQKIGFETVTISTCYIEP